METPRHYLAIDGYSSTQAVFFRALIVKMSLSVSWSCVVVNLWVWANVRVSYCKRLIFGFGFFIYLPKSRFGGMSISISLSIIASTSSIDIPCWGTGASGGWYVVLLTVMMDDGWEILLLNWLNECKFLGSRYLVSIQKLEFSNKGARYLFIMSASWKQI